MYIPAACTDQLCIYFINTCMYHMHWRGSRQDVSCIHNYTTISFIKFTLIICCIIRSVVFSTKFGLTALIMAAEGGHNETVQTLIAAGADVSWKVRL